MKKAIISMLAVVLTLSMTVMPVSAADDELEHSYKAYQVFSGVVSEGTLAEAEWGSGIDGDAFLAAIKADTTFEVDDTNVFANCLTAAGVGKVLSEEELSAKKLNKFAKLAADNIVTTPEDTGVVVSEDAISPGYYVIIDVTESVADKYFAKDIPLLQLTDEDGYIAVTSKAELPVLTKAIVVSNTEKSSATAEVDDDVVFRLKGTIPTDIKEYSEYGMEFVDTLPTGLTFKSFGKVKIDGEEVDKDYVKQTNTGQTVTVTLSDLETCSQAVGGSTIVAEYTVTVNSSATVGDTGNVNSAVLKFSNNPSGSSIGATLPATATVYVLDKTPYTLPNTGGIGTILFYALGAMLVCGGGVMLILRRRQADR